jgi:hypothetical protein
MGLLSLPGESAEHSFVLTEFILAKPMDAIQKLLHRGYFGEISADTRKFGRSLARAQTWATLSPASFTCHHLEGGARAWSPPFDGSLLSHH